MAQVSDRGVLLHACTKMIRSHERVNVPHTRIDGFQNVNAPPISSLVKLKPAQSCRKLRPRPAGVDVTDGP